MRLAVPTAVPSLNERASWVLERSGDPPELEIPRATQTTYLTHGLYRYAGKVPPPLVAYLLEKHGAEGDIVVDPMCGGGTTAIEAVTSGRRSINFDVSPVARTVTEAVSSQIDPADLLEFVGMVLDRYGPRTPIGDLEAYFSADTYGLLATALENASTPIERALALSIARSASRANTKKINTVVDPNKVPKPATELFVAAGDRFADAIASMYALDLESSSVHEAGATDLPLEAGSVDVVLLHPPYLTNTAYSESMELQLKLLGEDPKKLRKRELANRGSYFQLPNGLRKYLIGWAKIIAEAARILKPGGRLLSIVGDGRIDHVRIPVGSITDDFAKDAGLETVSQAFHVLNNQTGMTLTRRMTGQHVLVHVKP